MKFQKGHPRYGVGFLGKKHSDETKRKIGSSLKGIPKTEEANKKNSESHKGIKRVPFSDEWKRKIGDSHRGEKGTNWQGGKSFEEYGIDWTDDLKESIRKRDSHICQKCGIHQDEIDVYYRKLDVHHIDYNKYNLDPKNLISLCRKCHAKTNHDRLYWFEYFIRTQGGDFGFPYINSGRDVEKTKSIIKEKLLNKDIVWLIRKFWPVLGWKDSDLEKLNEVN